MSEIEKMENGEWFNFGPPPDIALRKLNRDKIGTRV